MKYNSYDINSMYVERTETGIDLYGSHFEQQAQTCVVVRSTKNMPELAQQIYGAQFTNERFIEKLKDRPKHNFIGNLAGPISMPISPECVSFVD